MSPRMTWPTIICEQEEKVDAKLATWDSVFEAAQRDVVRAGYTLDFSQWYKDNRGAGGILKHR